jgi:hypothetical protein
LSWKRILRPARNLSSRSGAALLAPSLLVCASVVAAQSAQDARVVPPRAGFTFPARQTLTYAVDWRVFPAGTTVLHLQQDGDQERISATADTLGAINLIYRVSDRFQSSFSRSNNCSAGFSKQLQEGRRQVNTDLKFDYAHGKALLDEKNIVKGTSKHEEASVGPCVTDLLSAIFYPASQPLTPGLTFRVPLGDAVHTVVVTMHAEARETVRTPLGTWQTVRVQPTADAGVVKARGNIWIWYTDDERHIPVQMRARLFWGTITFRLTAMDAK